MADGQSQSLQIEHAQALEEAASSLKALRDDHASALKALRDELASALKDANASVEHLTRQMAKESAEKDKAQAYAKRLAERVAALEDGEGLCVDSDFEVLVSGPGGRR